MVKAITGQTERTRPTSRFQQQNLLETTPVLFRLPTIELQPHQYNDRLSLDVPPNAQELAPTLMRNYTGSERHQEEAVRDSMVTRATKEATSASAIHADNVPETARSWLEHWTSGVVMILLIIAMVVLGVMAIRSNRQPVNSTIAATEIESEFGDLDSITIPTPLITESSTESSATTMVTTAEQAKPEFSDSKLATDLANAEVAPYESPSHQTTELSTPTDTLATSSSDLLLPATQSEQHQLATATLMQPTARDAPQQEYSQVPSIPSLGDLNQLSNSTPVPNSTPAQPAASQLGQSPSLYDEATRQMQSELSQSTVANPGLTNPALTNPALTNPALTNPALTNPALTNPAFSMPNLAGNRPTAAPATTQVSTPLSQGANKLQNPSLRSTATPDSNEEEIIRAYLELSQGTQPSPAGNIPPASSSNTNSPNRYQR